MRYGNCIHNHSHITKMVLPETTGMDIIEHDRHVFQVAILI